MDKPDDSQDKYIVPGLERGLLLLCEFSRKNRTLSAPELARRLKLPRSTIFRLLTTLETMGFVTRLGNEYRLGMAVLRLGFEYLASLELTELGQPLLNHLCDEIRYPCNLVVRDGRSIVYVAKVSPSTLLTSTVNVGTRLPAHATVLGRILLQDLSLGDLRELYPEEHLEQFSPNTPKTVLELFDLVQSDLDTVVNKLLVAEAKAMGGNKIQLLGAGTTPRHGIFALTGLIIGFPMSQATGVAVK